MATPLAVPTRHVDGTTKISSRRTDIRWLKDSPPDGVCRVLTNAKCLTEGVDVPALDAVMFLTPRRSKIDIVQAVGRVMRKPPGKQLGSVQRQVGLCQLARSPHHSKCLTPVIERREGSDHPKKFRDARQARIAPC